MDFFDKFKKIANETYKKTSKKTGELAKEAKIRMKMNEDKGKINDLYEEIGKIVYQKHLKNDDISIKEDLNSYCTQIDELSEKIEKHLDQLLSLKGKRICESCHEEIDLKVKYCPSCGKEQPEIQVEEIIEEEKESNNDETKEETEVKKAEIVEENENNEE